MNIQIVARVVEVLELEEVTPTFSKRVLRAKEEEDKYPNSYHIEASTKNAYLYDNLKAGQLVKFDCNVNSREYPKKDGSGFMCFTSFNCWKVEVIDESHNSSPTTPTPSTDLPFS